MTPHRSRHPCGFSLTEAIAVLACLVILAAIFIPYLRYVRERHSRVACADHLRQLQVALRLYGQDNNNDLPRVRSRTDGRDGYVAYSGVSEKNPFSSESTVQPNDVTASLYLLVRGGLVKPEAFVCPSTDDGVTTSVDAKSVSNFPTGPRGLSYSYAMPFSRLDDYRFNSDHLRSEFVVLADMNPGGTAVTSVPRTASPEDLRIANSHNHGGDGQNVLYGAGNVEFQVTPYCGFGHDNIYTALSATSIPAGQQPPPDETGVLGPQFGPAWYADSYLVPTETDNHPPAATTTPAR